MTIAGELRKLASFSITKGNLWRVIKRAANKLDALEWACDELEQRVEALRAERDALKADADAFRQVAHALGICYEAEGHDCHPGPLADVLGRVETLADIEREHVDDVLPIGRDLWHEADGPVLWWRFPVTEPPYCGTPLDVDFPDYVTHWTAFRVALDPFEEGRET